MRASEAGPNPYNGQGVNTNFGGAPLFGARPEGSPAAGSGYTVNELFSMLPSELGVGPARAGTGTNSGATGTGHTEGPSDVDTGGSDID